MWCLFVLCIPFSLLGASGAADPVMQVIQTFKRPITVLEIGRTALPYSTALSGTSRAIFVGILTDADPTDLIRKFVAEKIHTVTILHPTTLSHNDIETLGRCEHFDVVIVHDMPGVPFQSSRLVEALIRLGDYVFLQKVHPFVLECRNHHIPEVSQDYFLSHIPKRKLDLARFTQRLVRGSTGTYRIKSSLTEKFFVKNGKSVPWIEGINLVTFTMLKGVYPADPSIRGQLIELVKKYPEHNDFVLGNVIVQGDKLIPIDLKDKRRNADIQHCLKRALKAFYPCNSRLQNPEKWIRSYYATL